MSKTAAGFFTRRARRSSQALARAATAAQSEA
jgi:hypothetical protein